MPRKTVYSASIEYLQILDENGVLDEKLAKPGTEESADPLLAFVVTFGAFGFTVLAMLIPLLSEFDVALGRTTRGQE